MTVWLEFPPARLGALQSAYQARGYGETVQAAPLVDAAGARALIGTTRVAAGQLAGLSVQDLTIHTEFPNDWEYPSDDT